MNRRRRENFWSAAIADSKSDFSLPLLLRMEHIPWPLNEIYPPHPFSDYVRMCGIINAKPDVYFYYLLAVQRMSFYENTMHPGSVNFYYLFFFCIFFFFAWLPLLLKIIRIDCICLSFVVLILRAIFKWRVSKAMACTILGQNCQKITS